MNAAAGVEVGPVAKAAAGVRGRRRVIRDLPLAWKMALPPLLIVLVFTPPAFAIIGDLTSRAETDLRQGLERRVVRAKGTILADEFYLSESLRLAANIQGLPEAVARSRADAIQTAFESVLALKDRLALIAAADARGSGLATIAAPGRTDGEERDDWSAKPYVRAVLNGEAQRASFDRVGGTTMLVMAGKVLQGDRSVGVVVTGVDVKGIADRAAEQLDASLSLFDADGALIAARGDQAIGVRGSQSVRAATVRGVDVAILEVPLGVAGSNVGSLAVAVPRRPAFALAQRVTRNLELLLAGALIAGLGLLVLLTRLLLAQIAHLVRANEALAHGDLSARAPVLGRDELGRVAVGLNAMASELETSYAELERRVEERTRELSVARDAAEAASKAKAAFLANMSHEIRTPMNAVIGMTSLLLDAPLESQHRDYVETIRASGDHLLTIINDILDFSKIEAGRLVLEFHPFVVRPCIEEALDLVAFRASERRTELAYTIADDVPEAVLGDLGRLRQVLLNLLSNAVKFTEGGDVVVTVASRVVRGRRHELHFIVRDTGIGIPADRMEGLFGAFTQGDASTSRNYGGTGLGLAISRALVELMGGRMWAESKVGRGSEFHFTVSAEATQAPATVLPGSTPDLAGWTVLVVDDNETNRTIVAGYIARWGMSCLEASRPSEALKLLRAETAFDIALLDHDMPEMDGVQLAARIRKTHPRLPLVMLTSVGSLPRRASRDFAQVVTKPIKPSQLHDAIAGALAGRVGVAHIAARVGLDAGMAARHPLRILVAEDNIVNQKVAGAVLAKLGYQPDFASNGEEAIAAVARQPYDVVLMDVQMPEVDGLQAARAICREWTDGRRPRIVAMTANATPEDRRACVAAGMDDYLTKPVTPPKLIEALGRCVHLEAASSNGRRKKVRTVTRT